MKRQTLAILASTVLLSFSLQPARATSFKVLQTFCTAPETRCKLGQGPGELVADAAGNIYGATIDRGAYHGHGTIFEIAPGPHLHLLYTFCEHGLKNHCPQGENPHSPLILDTSGNLYGTTAIGGAYGNGTLFELSPNGDRTVWTLTTLYDFCAPGDPVCANGGGSAPGLTYAGAAGGLAWDGASPLYGVVSGSTDAPGFAGGVVQFTPGTPWTGALLYGFCQQGGNACTDGAIPNTTPWLDGSGNIFGTVESGGAANYGAVFEVSPGAGDTWSETGLHSFCSSGPPLCADGALPFGPVALDVQGNIYGTTIWGGLECQSSALQGQTCGVLYKIVPAGASSVETVLHAFCGQDNCTDGASPLGRVAIDGRGRIFGTTQAGGTNSGPNAEGPGILYRFDGSGFTVLHDFCALTDCVDGAGPQTGVIIGPNGYLYGSAYPSAYRAGR